MDVFALFDQKYLAVAAACLIISVMGAIRLDSLSSRRKAIASRAAEGEDLTDKESELLGTKFALYFLGIGVLALVAGAAGVESVCRSLGGTCVLTLLR